MINRPNKVFYISRELNFLQTPFTFDQIKDNILKSLVSGHGPFPVVSVKVVNKRAVVDLGEKARQYAGVKISIDGTGVADLDTWHEIQMVYETTFEFDVDVPDGDYSTGITMSYPSLGWRLLDRDANKFLLQTGTSASTTHHVLLEFNRGRPNWAEGENWRNTMTIEKVESDGTLASVRNPIPSSYTMGMKIPIEMQAPLNYDHGWFFYGDDAFVIFGYRGWWHAGSLHLRRANFNHVVFGELSRNQYKSGAFFINAEPNLHTFWERPYGDNGQNLTISIWAGFLAGGVTGNHASVVISTNINERYNYGDQANVYPTGYQPAGEMRSGFNFDLNISKYINNNYYNTPMIVNRRMEMVGDIPGFLFTAQMPHFSPAFSYSNQHNVIVESYLKPVKILGRLKGRHIYGAYTGGYNAWQNGAQNANEIVWQYQSSGLFDLTGPIR